MARSSALKVTRKQISAPRDRVAFPPRQEHPRAQQDRRLEARNHEAHQRDHQRDRRHEDSEPPEDNPPQDPDVQGALADRDPEWDSDAPDEDDDEWPCRPVETTFDKHKRRKQLATSLASNEGRKKDDKELANIKDDARFLYRALGPFIDVGLIMSQGIAYRNRNRDWTTFEDYFDKMTDDEVDQAVDLFDEFLKVLPSVARDIRWYAKKPSVVNDLAEFIRPHAAAGRVEDTNKLKYNVLLWVPEMPGYEVLPPNLDKSLRGFHNTTTARYLCPINMLDQFDRDPEGFCEGVTEGRIIIHGGSFPLFCYDEDRLDPRNPEAGLFMGPAIVANMRGIMTGNRNATKETGGPSSRGKKGVGLKTKKGKKPKVTSIYERIIAYVAIQIRFALCSQNSWTPEDMLFSLPLLYEEVISGIRDGSQEWRDELFKFHNRWMFGNPKGLPGEANAAAGIPADFVSAADELRKFRKDRAEREAAAAKTQAREHEAAAAMQQLAAQPFPRRESPMYAPPRHVRTGSPEQEVRPYNVHRARYSTPRERSTSRVRSSDQVSSTTSQTRKSATDSQTQDTSRSGRTTRRLAPRRRIDSPPVDGPPTPGPSHPRPEARAPHRRINNPLVDGSPTPGPSHPRPDSRQVFRENFSYGDFLVRSRDSSPRRATSRHSTPRSSAPSKRPGESENQFRLRVLQSMNGDD